MNKQDAHALLNAVLHGLVDISESEITAALWLTGDLKPVRRTYCKPVEVAHAVPCFVKESA